MNSKKNKFIVLGSGIIRFHFLTKTGNLKEITDDTNNVRINTYVGSNFESTISNIYLLVKDDNNKYYTNLIGVNSPSKFIFKNDSAIFVGEFKNVKYKIVLKVFDDLYIYSLSFKTIKQNIKIKVFYGQDISISDVGGISANEAYISQYIDHKVFVNDLGFTICSRQNQGRHNYFELGSLTKTVGYSTDGFQFFGNDYKLDYFPKALKNEKLDNEIYQYEFSYPALETDYIELKEDVNIKFYGGFMKNHDEETKEIKFFNKAKELSQDITFEEPIKDELMNPVIGLLFDNVYPYQKMSIEEIKSFYKDKWLFEEKDDTLYSFFLENKAHIVIPEKERIMERPSGDIILSMKEEDGIFDLEKAYASTTYIYGLFNSQIVYGNTSFNKLLSNQRNPLNLQKITGERIFIKIDDEYQLLTMPSIYEMGLNYAKWIYKINDDYLIIQNIVSKNDSKSTLYFQSFKGIEYDVLVTNHLTMKQTEDDEEIIFKVNNKQIRFEFNEGSLTKWKYPEYYFLLESNFDDYELLENNLLLLKYKTASYDITIKGCYKELEKGEKVLEIEKAKYLLYFDDLLNNLKITTTNNYLDSCNILSYWFLHDALIHYISPHGLEQYNGAAWGTRDVCQGPFELFKALGKTKEIKRIIKNVFSHQFIDTYTFPQWFMFDRFINICDTSSHGDVIIWPLRMVGMYLTMTNDFAILDKELPYLDKSIMNYSGSDTLYSHIKNVIKSIVGSFIEGTYLSCYGGGDWDDTLQPAKKEYKNKMVSGWTPLLTYETLNILSTALESFDLEYALYLKDLSENIKKDYKRLVIKDGVPAGFLLFDEGKTKYIIHPTDDFTHLNYRLLPLLRGGMSKVFIAEETLTANKIIEKYLLHPDGVRLMDRPIKYHGGINTYFQRAETASNFGREIGMQYCHAHIRYCEFLQKMGWKEKFNKEFWKINPIIIKDVVPNALARQRNSYFSSSDAFFKTRYQVQEHFEDIRNGKIGVKGGWRVYSSGSGIYMYNLITGLFGIEIIDNKLTLRPNVLDEGLKIEFKVFNKLITFIYHQGKNNILLNGKKVNYKLMDDRRFVIEDDLHNGDVIEIFS